jgi:hypothetical protein
VWLIYALGGGWGHLTRAVALARIAQRDRPVRVLTNSPYASIVASALPALDLVALDSLAPAEQTRAAVVREIAECRPRCLIVDTFPRGIGGELAGVLGELPARKVLVQRDLNPRYVAAARLREFVAAHYDLVLIPGDSRGTGIPACVDFSSPANEHRQECLCHSPPHILTDPWLVRCAGELPDRSRVKELLRLGPHEERCVLVCASGKKEELEWYGAVVADLHTLGHPVVRCVAADCPPGCSEECWVQYWPAMDLFGCAAVVVGGAGYNTMQECLAWKVPMIARPWPRTYDRQELRAQRASVDGRVIVVKDAKEATRAALEQMGDPPGLPNFANGAVEAVDGVARAFLPVLVL